VVESASCHHSIMAHASAMRTLATFAFWGLLMQYSLASAAHFFYDAADFTEAVKHPY